MIVCVDEGIWYTKSHVDSLRKIEATHFNNSFYLMSTDGAMELHGKRRKLIEYEYSLKWAWIVVGKTRKMAWVSKLDNRAFKADGYSKTWMEIKKFKFERWCTGFDL